jgi:hypothetical protein
VRSDNKITGTDTIPVKDQSVHKEKEKNPENNKAINYLVLQKIKMYIGRLLNILL